MDSARGVDVLVVLFVVRMIVALRFRRHPLCERVPLKVSRAYHALL